MLQHGALDDIDAIFFVHVLPMLPIGKVASRPGPMLAGAGLFSATIRGKRQDPIAATASAILSLQQIVSRETDPLEARVSGGTFTLAHKKIDVDN